MRAETERLIIRKIRNDDYSDIVEYGTDMETARYMIYWPKTLDQIKELIQKSIYEMSKEKPSSYELVLELKEQKKVIGNISIIKQDGISEIGWILNKTYWNKGLMTEGLKEVLKILKDNDINKIYATCNKNNIASSRVMEKIGMKIKEIEENKESIKQGTVVRYTKLRYEMCI